MFRRLKNQGFTLIELLIVIGIIAILAGAVVIAISPGKRLASARDATRERHVQAIEQAVLSYQVDNEGNFPETLENSLGSEICNTNLENPNCGDLIDLSILTEEGYLSSLPLKPGKEEGSQGIGYKIATVKHELAVWPTKSETRQLGARPALEFDGEREEYINAEAINVKSHTVAFWFRSTNETLPQEYARILSNGATSTGDRAPLVTLHNSGDGSLHWMISTTESANTGISKTNNVIKKDKPSFWVGAVDGSKKKIRIYKNGEISDLGDFEGLPDVGSWSYLRIGPQAGRGLGQVLSDVRIYDRALSANEIKSLYQGQKITAGLVGHWPLDEGKGDTAYDHSGNENHGSLVNNPQWVVGR